MCSYPFLLVVLYISRSPDELLAEIILVDDASTMEHLGKDLENYMAQYPKVSSSLSSKENQLLPTKHYDTKENKLSPTRYYDRKQKGENCPSSKKKGSDPGSLVGGGKGDDE